MNLSSQPAPQTRTFQSWRWIFLATILMVTVAISTFYLSSVQAQSSRGAITGLTLTSNAPGTLTVSWDATNPTPTDYRVDWAKSTEGYKSWKVDEGHKYPAPTATRATIANLEHNTQYKIRMRARYYTGEHEDKSWGGPWATKTITVAGEPVETPTPEPETPNRSRHLPLNQSRHLPLNQSRHLPLNQSRHPPLSRQKHPPLSRSRRLPLNPRKHPPLSRRKHPPLSQSRKNQHLKIQLRQQRATAP